MWVQVSKLNPTRYETNTARNGSILLVNSLEKYESVGSKHPKEFNINKKQNTPSVSFPLVQPRKLVMCGISRRSKLNPMAQWIDLQTSRERTSVCQPSPVGADRVHRLRGGFTGFAGLGVRRRDGSSFQLGGTSRSRSDQVFICFLN